MLAHCRRRWSRISPALVKRLVLVRIRLPMLHIPKKLYNNKKHYLNVQGVGPGAVVKAACLESRSSRDRTPLWHSNFKEKKCFFHAHT